MEKRAQWVVFGTVGNRSVCCQSTPKIQPMHTPFSLPAPARRWLAPALLAIVAVAGCASAPPVRPEAPAPSKVLARADLEVRQPATQWTAEGVQSMDGAPLPALENASLLLPAGARRPSWLARTFTPSFATTTRPAMRSPLACWRSSSWAAPQCRRRGHAIYCRSRAANCWRCKRR